MRIQKYVSDYHKLKFLARFSYYSRLKARPPAAATGGDDTTSPQPTPLDSKEIPHNPKMDSKDVSMEKRAPGASGSTLRGVGGGGRYDIFGVTLKLIKAKGLSFDNLRTMLTGTCGEIAHWRHLPDKIRVIFRHRDAWQKCLSMKKSLEEFEGSTIAVVPFTRFECQMYACAVYAEGFRYPDGLPEYFMRFGPLADVKVSRNGRGAGYAVMTFVSPSARERALCAAHPWPLVVRRYGQRADEGKGGWTPRARGTDMKKARPPGSKKDEAPTSQKNCGPDNQKKDGNDIKNDGVEIESQKKEVPGEKESTVVPPPEDKDQEAKKDEPDGQKHAVAESSSSGTQETTSEDHMEAAAGDMFGKADGAGVGLDRARRLERLMNMRRGRAVSSLLDRLAASGVPAPE
jgi:hypothetical protein